MGENDEDITLTKFISDEDEQVGEAAAMVKLIREKVDAGELTTEQGKELYEDLCELDKILDLADDLERKIKVEKAISVFKVVLKGIL